MNLKEMKKDILEYNLYWLLDAVEYGDYYLTIINERDSIIIHIEDDEGFATWAIDKEDFLSIDTTEELERLINSILYYNYIAYEGE